MLFIHGFISSSSFWSETVFPNISEEGIRRYRLIAVDLLGFGRSPKPADSLYTLRDHIDMIERSVLEPYKVKSLHIVAHSLGNILALALAVKYAGAVKSLTLLAPVRSPNSLSTGLLLVYQLRSPYIMHTLLISVPIEFNWLASCVPIVEFCDVGMQPYFPVPKGANASQYVLRKVAPRRVWPPMAMGASMGSWYEHISRTICLIICKNHRVWEFIAKLVTRNR